MVSGETNIAPSLVGIAGTALAEWGARAVEAIVGDAAPLADPTEINLPETLEEKAIVFVESSDDLVRQLGARMDRLRTGFCATRFLAQISPWIGHADVLTLQGGAAFDPDAAARRIAAFLGAPPAPAPSWAPPDRPPLAGDLLALAERTIAPMRRLVVDGGDETIVWPRRALSQAEAYGEPIPDRMPLVGRARTLVNGPYYYLPPGRWEATVRVAFDERAANRVFVVDIAIEDAIGAIRLRPAEAGEYEAVLAFDHDRFRYPLTIRMWMERGAIEGQAGFGDVSLRRVARL